jgi:hypothetical protein
MNRPVQLGTASLKALGIVVAIGVVAHAGMPYLPMIGPPPLRVLATKAPASAAVKWGATLLAATNLPPGAAAGIVSGTTNVTVDGTAVEPVLPAEPTLGETFSSSVFALPTPDLVGITPQMLAAYLRPVQAGTNAILTGPFHVSFLPPLPPDKSSHAEYNVK